MARLKAYCSAPASPIALKQSPIPESLASKPHREIFEAALKTMKAQPEESLYVGDIYSVDYLGARNASMDAVLFDVAGTYRDRGLPRVESLTELEKWLER